MMHEVGPDQAEQQTEIGSDICDLEKIAGRQDVGKRNHHSERAITNREQAQNFGPLSDLSEN